MKKANNIGQHIAQLRALRGLSQKETVRKIQCLSGKDSGMTIQMLKNIETGRTSVLHWQIIALHAVFRCTYEDIFIGPKG
ncbi:MAG: helix-turn-helix transcriptional regulator [Acidobacteriota bacterium]